MWPLGLLCCLGARLPNLVKSAKSRKYTGAKPYILWLICVFCVTIPALVGNNGG